MKMIRAWLTILVAGAFMTLAEQLPPKTAPLKQELVVTLFERIDRHEKIEFEPRWR